MNYVLEFLRKFWPLVTSTIIGNICVVCRLRVDFVPLTEIGEKNMSETATWQPSASIPNLLKRAALMAEIRRFFADRGVLEVETPCMSQATVTDIHMVPFGDSLCWPGTFPGNEPVSDDQPGNTI
ncbi:poxB regulator PoxA [Kluyvera cryocrescens]|uniref:PoxB regulator PoxA n=1 Tax=Kluyvera cryocrescens TaxID=580 RepID=A0A485D798_KLUCR|nr:poxB regulator PoxA [Kluyvera cryocrescens]